MEMPKPGEAHERLHKLAGDWSGGEKLHPAPWDPAGGPAQATVANRVILDGWAVVQEYQQSRGGQPNFSGHGIFWYDPATGEYAMTWVDSMAGQPATFRGGFEGDVLRLTNAMADGGFARCSFDCSEPDQYAFLMEVSQDGQQWMPAMEGTYTKGARKAVKTTARKAAAKKAKARKAAAPKKAAKAARKAAPKAAKTSAKKVTAKAPARKAAKKSAKKR